MNANRKVVRGAVGLATALVLAAPATAIAAQGGAGSGGHGGTKTETATNNLSTPTILVGGSGLTNVTCGTAQEPSSLVAPSGSPLSGYPIDTTAYYYVQGVSKWQAQCYAATSASATAAWGDNLTGDAKLSTNSPIRVELGLMNADTAAPSMQGYTVDKLDPNALDRESPYGTLAQTSTGPATATDFAYYQQRVYDSKATFAIHNDTADADVVAPGTAASAEINATGNVVYGYNLTVKSAGTYTITFTVPDVSLTGTDAGTITSTSVSLTIDVTGGTGGGGGGKGHNR